MENKKKKPTLNTYLLLFMLFILITSAIIVFFMTFSTKISANPVEDLSESETRSYHIVVLGSYENASFLKLVCSGAEKHSEKYNAVIQYYVPESQAEDISIQSLIDYAGYVNADGIIAYIDSSEEMLEVPSRIDGTQIPLVTTGFFSSNFTQISFIGNNYWELGKKLADETIDYFLEGVGGIVYIVTSNSTINSYYSSLLTSLQSGIKDYNEIECRVINQNESELLLFQTDIQESIKAEKDILLICLTEEDTIKTAQTLQEAGLENEGIGFIGFGSSETSKMYMEKSIIKELISVDPEKIGELAITELFEYRNKGYANSYITPDIEISKSPW